MKFWKSVRNHYLVDTFLNLKGNSRYCIDTEPLWFIPYSLYIPFATIYMYRLGVTDSQIGLLLTIGMFMQVIASFFGGVLTDKLGRRVTTVIFDLISWSVPCLIWAFAQNFWWFVAATLLNSMWQITNNSWSCLLVEDCDKRYIVTIYSFIQICSLLSVFFAPISSLLVDTFDVVPVMRGLYIFSFISMTIKFLILFFKGHETEQGYRRMQETKGVSIFKLAGGYKSIFLKIIQSKQMLLVLAVMLCHSITNNTVTQTFFGLYATEQLGIGEEFLAIFPMIRSAIMLVFIFALQATINKLPFRPVMTVGYLLFIGANVLLVFAPPQSLEALFLYTILEGCALACVVPRKDSIGAIFIDQQERSRASALLYMLSIGLTAPFGWIAGLLSEANRSLPFVLNVTVFVCALLLILFSKEITKLDQKNIHH